MGILRLALTYLMLKIGMNDLVYISVITDELPESH